MKKLEKRFHAILCPNLSRKMLLIDFSFELLIVALIKELLSKVDIFCSIVSVRNVVLRHTRQFILSIA